MNNVRKKTKIVIILIAITIFTSIRPTEVEARMIKYDDKSVIPLEVQKYGIESGKGIYFISLDNLKLGIGEWLKARCYDYFKSHGGKGVLPSVIFCQMGNETGWGSDGSQIVLKANNLLCMRGTGTTGTFQSSSYGSFASFGSWDECLEYYFEKLENSQAIWVRTANTDLLDLNTWQEQIAFICSGNYCTEPEPYTGIYFANAVAKIMANQAYILDSEIMAKFKSTQPTNSKDDAFKAFNSFVTSQERVEYYLNNSATYKGLVRSDISQSENWLENPRCGLSSCSCGYCWVASKENLYSYVGSNGISISFSGFEAQNFGQYAMSSDQNMTYISDIGLVSDNAISSSSNLSGYYAEIADVNELSYSDRKSIAVLQEDYDSINKNDDTTILRVAYIVFGIALIVYTTVLFVAYSIDRSNTLLDFELLKIVSLGRLRVDDEIKGSENTKGCFSLNFSGIVVVLTLGYTFGILIVTGKMFKFIHIVIEGVNKILKI